MIAGASHAQDWPPLNLIHPCNWHEEPQDEYRPHCFLSDVHVNESQSDGIAYLAFGYGKICHFSNCSYNEDNPTASSSNHRVFTLALNETGQIEEVHTFTHEPFPYGHQRWNNGNLWSTGTVRHTTVNVDGLIVAIVNDSENFTGPGSLTTHQFLYHFQPNGQLAQEPALLIEGDPLRYYDMGGVFEDPRDSTYLIYGQEIMREVPYGDYTSERSALMKFEPNGDLIWSRTYSSLYISSVIMAESGGYWLSSVSTDLANNDCNLPIGTRTIQRVDEVGLLLSTMHIPGACRSSHFRLFETIPDEIVVIGRSNIESGNFNPDFPDAGSFFSHIISYDAEQLALLELGPFKTYLPDDEISNMDSAIKLEDGYLIGGFFWHDFPHSGTGTAMTQQKGMLLKLDENRDSLWARFYAVMTFDPTWMQHRHSMGEFKPTPDGGFICVGYIENVEFSGERMPWVLKVDEYGCLEPGCQFVGVDEFAIDMRGSLTAYPNPTTDQLRIKLTLPDGAAQGNRIELVMHDLQGRVVYRQNHPELQLNETTLNVTNFETGLYTLHCIINGVWVDSEKVVVE
jgi:hypothetical protein